ncbi:MAG TPA: hypothetical protein VF544_04815 [Pyrinomonadaceae bacterium]|jgi:hypothetical protein
MRGGRLRLIRILAFILVIGLAIFSPLSSSLSDKAVNVGMNLAQPVARTAEIARPRPEVRIERVLKLEELAGFDPDLASLLMAPREQRITHNSQAVEQLAALSSEYGKASAP